MSIFSPAILGLIIIYTGGLIVTYFVLRYLFPYFFNEEKGNIKNSRQSLIWITVISIIGYIVIMNIRDPLLSNRLLHGFSGGFMAFFTCFLAYRDSHVRLNKFQFFFFSLLIVTGLGVVNEIIEWFFQTYGTNIFALTISDTWLDLISNSVGILIAAACFTPFAKKDR